MDARQLTAILKNPTLLHSISADELQDAANRYPYSSLLQTLLVKKYQLLGETDLDTNLARAALLHPDREQLSHFIDQQIADISAVKYDETVVVSYPEQVAQPTIASVVAEEPLVEETAIVEFFSPDVEPILLEDLVQPMVTETPVIEEIEPVEEPVKKIEEAAPINIQKDKLSFSDWLRRVKEGEVSDAHALDQQIQAVGYEAMLMRSAEEPKTEKPAAKPVKEEKQKPAKATKEEKPPKDEVWEKKVSQMAQKSVAFDDDLVTETLAKIFELQKKYSKALDAYEKLLIRYPEKSIQYNAAIERLKARLA